MHNCHLRKSSCFNSCICSLCFIYSTLYCPIIISAHRINVLYFDKTVQKKDAESLPRPHIYLALSSLTFGAVSLIPYTVNRLSKSTFVWWLKMLSEPFTKSSSDNAMSIYNFITQRSMIDFYLEFKLSPMHCYLKESQMAVRYTFVCSILILHIR